MEVRINDLSVAPELRQHFERSGFVVRQINADTLCVERPDAPTKHESEREVAAHLAVWRVMHPGSIL